MKRNLNRRKFSFITKKNLFYVSLFTFLLILIFIIYYQKNFLLKNFKNSIENFSKNFEYQYLNLDVEGLVNVEYSFLENTLKEYSKSSIFLLPLNTISIKIKENNWIKNVKLSTNNKDTLFIKIEEYEPIGLYHFNNKLFYFDKVGKIIDQANKNLNFESNLTIFYGKGSNLNAKFIIDIIENLSFKNKFKINRIEYINKRRWNIYLKNNVKLMLSESFPKNSLKNFIDIEKKLSKTDMNNISNFDLRNIDKTLITYIE